jgi:hypothetical protein
MPLCSLGCGEVSRRASAQLAAAEWFAARRARWKDPITCYRTL